jgi:hypothetical protein
MTNAGPDPVNRWATEHYGFEDDAADQDATTTPTPPSRTASTPTAPPGRRRNALVAAGVLVASLVAGFGGVAVAADAPGDGTGGDRGAVTVRFDGDGGRAGGDRGDIGGFDGRGFGRP